MPEVSIDFDEPRFGPVCVHAVAGDTLKFQWDEWHNLHELPDFEAYEPKSARFCTSKTTRTSSWRCEQWSGPSKGRRLASR